MSYINKIETMQAKILRTIVNVPWYVRNDDIRRDLGIPTIKEEISRYSEKYKSRIATHPNRLAAETINHKQNHKHGQKTKQEAPSRPYKGHNLRNPRMVSRWG